MIMAIKIIAELWRGAKSYRKRQKKTERQREDTYWGVVFWLEKEENVLSWNMSNRKSLDDEELTHCGRFYAFQLKSRLSFTLGLGKTEN